MRWPSCLRIMLLNKNAPNVPHNKDWANAIGRVLLRGNAAKVIAVTPTKTAIGAAAAAACPGFGAL